MTKLEQWISNPREMGADALRELSVLLDASPYCTAYRMLYVAALANVHSTKLETELKKHAVALPDRVRLFQLINHGEYEWVTLMQQLEERRQQKEEVNDFELIDKFLESMQNAGNADVSYSIEDLANAPGFGLDEEWDDQEPAYERSAEDEEQERLIDNFLMAEEEGTLFVPQAEKTEMPDDDPNLIEKIKDRAFLTESLAKVYVKQHKYEQALAIFSELNLKYSKKNCYFADQIRYLEKVIAYTKAESDTDNQ